MDVQPAALPTVIATAQAISPRQLLTYTGAALLDETAPDRCVWFRAATRAKDRHGTVIEPGGIDLRYHRQNPVFIWSHAPGRSDVTQEVCSPEVAIGRVVEYRQVREALDVCVEFDTDPFADLCYRKVQRGFLNAVSIGAVLFGKETIELNGVEVPYFPRSELWEISLVLVGSNREALRIDRSAPLAAQRAAALDYLQHLDSPDAASAGTASTSAAGTTNAPALRAATADATLETAAQDGADASAPRDVLEIDGGSAVASPAGGSGDGSVLMSAARAGGAESAGGASAEHADRAQDAAGGAERVAEDAEAARQPIAAPAASRAAPALPYGPDSVMIALYPTEAEAAALALTGERAVAAAELHVTLAALGSQADLPGEWLSRVQPMLRDLADHLPPLVGKVTGFGRFCLGETHTQVALPSVPGAADMHHEVRERLRWSGVPFKDNYGFQPHLSLAFLHADEADLPVGERAGLPLSFSAISLVFSGTRYDFLLSAPDRVLTLADKAGGAAAGGAAAGAGAEEKTAQMVDAQAEVQATLAEDAAALVSDRSAATGDALPWPDRYLTSCKDVGASGTPVPAPLLTAKVERSAMNRDDYRYAVRAAVSYTLEAAELHGYLSENGPEAHRAMHLATCVRYLDDAGAVLRTYAAVLGESEEGVVREAPAYLTNAAARSKYAEVAALAGRLPKTASMVCRDAGLPDMGDALADELMAQRAAGDELIRLRSVNTANAAEAQNARREELLASYLQSGAITPAEAVIVRGASVTGQPTKDGPWTPERLERYVATRQVRTGGPVVPVAAVAALRQVPPAQVAAAQAAQAQNAPAPARRAAPYASNGLIVQSATGGQTAAPAAPAPAQVDALRSTSLQQGQPPRLRVADAAPQGAGPTVESLAARLSSVTGLSTEAILRSVPQVLSAKPPSEGAETINTEAVQ